MKTHGPNDYIAPDYANDLEARVAELERALRAIVITNPVADYVLDIHALEIRNIARAALKEQA